MKTKITYLIVSLLFLFTAGKAQLHLDGGGKININGGNTSANSIFLVLNDPPATPIVDYLADAGNGIIMEDEFNRLQYNLGSSAAGTVAITVPFMAGSPHLEKFPLTVSGITAGTETTTSPHSGNIRFSSKPPPAGLGGVPSAKVRADGWDNTLFMPSGVTTMASAASSNASDKTIDRFWIIDATGYSVKPAATLDIYFKNAEAAANGSPGSVAPSLGANMKLQRWSSSATGWAWNTEAYPPAGTYAVIDGTTGKIQVTVTATDFFSVWAMHDQTAGPLPIELLEFEASCDGKNAQLEWSTASETNNDFFTIERSTDATNWDVIGTVNGAGNSTQTLHYQFTDNSPENLIMYYRLKQTDFNGDFKYSDIVSTDCDKKGVDFISIYPNPSNGSFSYVLSSALDAEVSVKAFDVVGQKVIDEIIYVEKGVSSHSINISSLSNGVYYLQVVSSNGLYEGQKQFVIH